MVRIATTATHPRITIEADKRAGKGCIRGHRITVEEVLPWLAARVSEKEILADYPQMQKEDFQAIYAYAADQLMIGGRTVSH
jgi:uncharacterized protein (DUF433 family)